MKKIIPGLPLLFFMLFGLTSCGDKCVTCEYTAGGTPVVIDKCGSKSEIKDFEESVNESAKLTGAAVGEIPIVTCKEL